MTHEHKLTADCRAKALEAGEWQTSTGHFIELRKMPDSHLCNAMLQAISNADDPRIIELLAVEIERRDISELATAMAMERERKLQWFHRR